LADRPVALVTGSARRVGRILALRLADEGFDLVVHYRHSREDAESTAALARERGARVEHIRADLASVAEIEGLFGAVAEQMGRLDLLVNNASTFERTPFGEVREPQFDALVDSNLKGPFFCSQFAAALMDEGHIVNVVDPCVERPDPDFLPYFAAKAGLVALTRGMARALAPRIRVNAIAPGPVLFPEHYTASQKRRDTEETLLRRPGSPEDVAAALLFLLRGSDYVTGAVIPVDGGRALSR